MRTESANFNPTEQLVPVNDISEKNKVSERIVISYTFIASTFTFDLFKTVLGNFVDVVEEWQQKCENMQLPSMDDGNYSVPAPNDPTNNLQFV